MEVDELVVGPTNDEAPKVDAIDSANDPVATTAPEATDAAKSAQAEAERKAHAQNKIKLPVELIGRVFDFYYDLVHDGEL